MQLRQPNWNVVEVTQVLLQCVNVSFIYCTLCNMRNRCRYTPYRVGAQRTPTRLQGLSCQDHGLEADNKPTASAQCLPPIG